MKQKLAVTLQLAGGLLLLWTAGASDRGLLSIGRIAGGLAIAIALLLLGGALRQYTGASRRAALPQVSRADAPRRVKA